VGVSANTSKPLRSPSARRTALEEEKMAAQLEREYIKNLQQQVYFLELELNYSKQASLLALPPTNAHGETNSTNSTLAIYLCRLYESAGLSRYIPSLKFADLVLP